VTGAANSDRAKAWVVKTKSSTLQRVVEQAPADGVPGPGNPLAGLVHIEGVGRVPVSMMRRELEKRRRER
jgi:hypothetical protein